jgi:hypothetical protein
MRTAVLIIVEKYSRCKEKVSGLQKQVFALGKVINRQCILLRENKLEIEELELESRHKSYLLRGKDKELEAFREYFSDSSSEPDSLFSDSGKGSSQ